MGWLFGRKREPADANEMLRRYNEAEARRLEDLTSAPASGADLPGVGAPISVSLTSARFPVEDVFTITGRGQVVTGMAASGVFRVDDDIAILRDGSVQATTRIAGIEVFRAHTDQTVPGQMSGLLLRDRVDVARGDVIVHASSG
ncbi:EF-Tu/IF-2/RF-3 family GTPase [Microbacterium sp.]|uniref:EF-Tu/IF-2/RF-3 family GTPase n=1 Tax=Microbacterium sp. TaxID=51671 RepID=UPI003566454B